MTANTTDSGAHYSGESDFPFRPLTPMAIIKRRQLAAGDFSKTNVKYNLNETN